jgi:hypothetical protein
MKQQMSALVLALALAAPAAFAQPGPPGPGQGQGPREFRGPPPGYEGQRREDWHGGRGQDPQRQEQWRQREMEGRQQRMSPEDRQDLRRDIRNHGRDVYGPQRGR